MVLRLALGVGSADAVVAAVVGVVDSLLEAAVADIDVRAELGVELRLRETEVVILTQLRVAHVQHGVRAVLAEFDLGVELAAAGVADGCVGRDDEGVGDDVFADLAFDQCFVTAFAVLVPCVDAERGAELSETHCPVVLRAAGHDRHREHEEKQSPYGPATSMKHTALQRSRLGYQMVTRCGLYNKNVIYAMRIIQDRDYRIYSINLLY